MFVFMNNCKWIRNWVFFIRQCIWQNNLELTVFEVLVWTIIGLSFIIVLLRIDCIERLQVLNLFANV